MEIKDLYAYLPLKAELEHERREKYKLQVAATSVVPTLTGMPGGHDAQSKVERYGIRIHDTELRIKDIERRLMEIETFIDGVEVDTVRVICKLKFYDGLTYRQIAGQIGGNNTGEGVKMILHRYFWQLNKNNG